MASALTAPATLENLRPRPPTPPRELYLQPERADHKPLRPTPISHLNLHTPPSVQSAVSANKSGSGTGRMGKRVVWSGRDEIHEAPKVPGQSSPALPSSAQSKPPLKSILKPSASPVPIAPSALDGTGESFNIIEMLDSSIKQLAGADRDSKIDAYTMLNRAIKTSNNLPDRVALQDKMSLLTQFIQRDILSKNPNGSLDTSLVNQALMLLATFVQFPAIASVIPADFAIFFIDHAVKTFEDPATPKDVARYFMQVGHSQSFGPKVMTLDRVGRLVASLHNIEEHTKGKSIVMARILFYRKLIKQARNHMAVHADWLKDMFVDMLSTMKDIRTHAIYLGLDAGFMYQKGRQLTRKVMDILQTSNDEDQSYIEFYFQKLREIIRDKDRQRLLHVPQILSVITLFLKCPLDRWEYYNPWLQLMQLSFNSSDWQTKHEANYAWNRYVYLSLKDLPLKDTQQTKKSLSVLVQPLLSQLRGKKGMQQAEESKKLRRTLIGGVCNLYYYALSQDPQRQNQETKRQLAPEVTWDVAVQPAITLLTDGAQAGHAEDSMQALRILVSLLDVSTPTFWREERIQEQPPVKPDELPSIEAKWIKKNSDRIFAAITPIILEKFVDLANRDSLTYRLWQAVIKSVSLASAKEIKVSEDTAKWFAKSLGLLSSIWRNGCAESDEPLQAKFFQSTSNFIKIMVDNLGLLPWTECKLCASVADTFVPVATPSHRPDKSNKGVVRKPLHHLFTTLSTLPSGVSDDQSFSDFFQSAFEPFFIGKSDKVRLDLTRELLCLLPQNTLSPFAPWALGSQAAQLSLSTSESNKLVPTSTTGTEYRDIVNCLCNGLTLHPNLPPATWLALYEPFAQQVRAAVGAPGLALAVIEPIAKVLGSESRTNEDLILTASKVLFESAELPRDRQALEAARRRLWGPIPPGVSKESSADPFQHLYEFGNAKLKLCYNNLEEGNADRLVTAFIKAVDSFLSKTFVSGLDALTRLNSGLSVWIQDEKAQEKLKRDSQLSVALLELWTNICNKLTSCGQMSKSQFDLVEDLLAAGFRSKQPSIVEKTTQTWNVIAKDEENVECSDSLKTIVSSLRSRPEDVEDVAAEPSTGGFGAQATSYPGSHNNNHTIELSTGTSHEAPEVTAKPTAPTEKSRSSKRKRRREAESTPEPLATRTSKRKSRPSSRTSTPRLRHDDSQIQFQPIAASSSPVPGESQHLTERQEEVRDKQRSNAAVFPDLRTSSPPAAVDAPTVQAKEVGKGGQPEAQRETTPVRHTPERKSTYGELISSTPTPRRGQILHMLEGANDPPSSPPEPRANPLASQIQSRPKPNDSMEDWELSSPPVSPVTSRQQVAQDAELPHVTLTNESPEAPSAANEAQEKPSKAPTPSPDVIPSSLPPAVAPTTRSTRAKSRAARASAAPAVPVTPPSKKQRAVEPSSSREQDDEFVDAKTNQEPSSPVLPELPSMEDSAMETSYTFSQVANDSQLANFAVELEAGDVNLPQLPLTVVPSSSPEKAPADQRALKYAAGEPDEPRDEADESQPHRAASGEAASELSVGDSQEGKRKRKRKRSKASGSQRKRRRSSEPSASQPASPEKQNDSAAQASQTAAKPKPSTRARSTRRSARMLAKEQEVEEAEVSQEQQAEPGSQPDSEVQIEEPQQTVEPANQDEEESHSPDRDTDEELMSQLYEESVAASESQSASREATEALSTIEDSMDVVSTGDNPIVIKVDEDVPGQDEEQAEAESQAEPEEEEQQAPANKAEAIMARLRTGMEDLRTASLSRDEFNKIEDMLFDMKRELFEAERRGRPQ